LIPDVFKEWLKDRIIVLDGAVGTQLQKRGMPLGVCPELWVLEHPHILMDIQREYIQAGSRVLYTATLGGNSIKLEEFGLGHRVVEINKELALITRRVAGEHAIVAGDISTTGKYIEPLGDITFEHAVNIYKEQVKGLLEGGVDLFIIETMTDIQEARAALLAVKESCNLPVWVSLTFQEGGRTLTGTDPVTAVITLQNLGAHVVGCNCSTGPEEMVDIIGQMKAHAKVPLLAKPNAGLPKLVDGMTVFNMGPEELGRYAKFLAQSGANFIGGCCGTSAEHINQISLELEGISPIPPLKQQGAVMTSSRKTVIIGHKQPLTIVGERINPTGKSRLQKDLMRGRYTYIGQLAQEQVEKGAAILDVNVGMTGIDEKQAMIDVINFLSTAVDAPLCLDSANPQVIEQGLRIYPGRAIVNSISLEKEKIHKLLPVAAKYGAMFILLPLHDGGIPMTAEEKREIVAEIYKEAKGVGYQKEDIIVDGLVMAVSSHENQAVETLKLVEWCTHLLGFNSILGLSNVSFGLPERGWLNAAFLAMALGKGLTAAIANPSSEIIMNIKTAAEVLLGKDAYSQAYIEHFTQAAKAGVAHAQEKGIDTIEKKGKNIFEAVVKGERHGILSKVDDALAQGSTPQVLMDRYLIPAMTHVGELFEKKEYFLPQLIMSAETMKKAFEHLEPLLETDEKDFAHKTKVILATVKGDIHDIGKNIVGLMLRNYGFEVIDLGKDVSAETIIQCIKETSAQIVGLSALMTTTMVEMEEVIFLAKKQGLKCKFMVGGAAVTQQFADKIGADGYAEDANGAVKLATRLEKLL
jgi:5-methyltetrahydrofolate--homocysteine methyltransferase